MDEIQDDKLYTYKEAGKILGLSPKYLKKLKHLGSVETVTKGNRVFFEGSYLKDMRGRAVLKLVYRRAGQ